MTKNYSISFCPKKHTHNKSSNRVKEKQKFAKIWDVYKYKHERCNLHSWQNVFPFI